MDQTLHRVATKEREEIKRTTKQKMVRRHNKEGGNHLDQESIRQKTKEDIDGRPHAAVDEQNLAKRRKAKEADGLRISRQRRNSCSGVYCRQNKLLFRVWRVAEQTKTVKTKNAKKKSQKEQE